MQVLLLAVGKLRPPLRQVCDDYVRRLSRFIRVAEREVREAGRTADVAAQRDTEGARLLAGLPDAYAPVLLDQGGQPWSSEQLARQLDAWRHQARDRAIIIGGAAGVAPAVRRRADVSWSLGPLTLPHELARVIVVEQLYRASTILLGQPYHRGGR